MAVIMADSTCDLTLEEAKRLQIHMLSLKVTFGDEVYTDKVTITNEEFYEKLKKSEAMPTTSLVGVGDFMDAFEKYPDDDIVVLTLSSKLSGTYQSAVMAKQETGRENIYVVDTNTVSIGLALLVRLAVKMRDDGERAENIAKRIHEISRRVQVYAIVDTLKYLVKGGRLPAIQGAIGGVLLLKPIITIADGRVFNIKKSRGMKAAIKDLAEIVLEKNKIAKALPIAWAHTGNLQALTQLMEVLGSEYVGSVGYLGSVVGAHAGPGTIAIAYFKE